MSSYNPCSCKGLCVIMLLAAIILGIITALLFFFGLVPTLTAVFPFIVAAALGMLLFLGGLLVFNSSMPRSNMETHCNILRCTRKCICGLALCLLIASIGTLVGAIILLTFPLVPTALLSIVLVFIFATLFWWMVLTFFGLLACIIGCICDE